MTEDFANWLNKHPETKKEYQEHHEWRNEIFKDYQLETAYEDFDSWLKWALENEESARNHFPYVMAILGKAVLRSSDFKNATVIQIAADAFPKWRKEANDLIGPAKRKFIQSQINLNELVLEDIEEKPEMVKDTILNRKDEFEGNLKYWQDELQIILSNPNSSTLPTSETEKMILEIIDSHSGWSTYFKTEHEFKRLLVLLAKHFNGENNSLPEQPIGTKKGTKTKLAGLLGRLHYDLSDNKLRSDKQYLELVRCIDRFKEETDVYKALIRDR